MHPYTYISEYNYNCTMFQIYNFDIDNDCSWVFLTATCN